MAEVNQLSDGRPDGTCIGQSASDLVSVHGASPTAQASFVAEVTVPGWSVGGYGATGTANLTALYTLVEALRDIAVNKGFMASS